MKIGRFVTRFVYSFVGVVVVSSASPARALAQHGQGHTAQTQKIAGALINVVREATERFKDVSVAEYEEYQLLFGCVSGPDAGAMGMHFVNVSKAFDDVLDATNPEIVIYEPLPNGRLRLIGADYLILADKWHANNPTTTPEIMGQLLHYFDSPNRFGLPPFYTLHVWAWKESPSGPFVNWHPKVSCDAYAPQDH
jgi:hypothetical protein